MAATDEREESAYHGMPPPTLIRSPATSSSALVMIAAISDRAEQAITSRRGSSTTVELPRAGEKRSWSFRAEGEPGWLPTPTRQDSITSQNRSILRPVPARLAAKRLTGELGTDDISARKKRKLASMQLCRAWRMAGHCDGQPGCLQAISRIQLPSSPWSSHREASTSAEPVEGSSYAYPSMMHPRLHPSMFMCASGLARLVLSVYPYS